MKKKAIVFVLSDFMDEGYDNALKIVGKKHDVTGIRVYDKIEEELPKIGMVPMKDAETGEVVLVNTNSKAVRTNYRANYLKTVDFLKTRSPRAARELSIRVWTRVTSGSC